MISLTKKFQGTNYRRTITGINYVIFTGSPSGAAATQKYSIPDQITVAGATFPQLPGNLSPGVHAGASASAATFGFFVGGGLTATDPTFRYAYSGDVITNSAPLGIASSIIRMTAAGNGELCLISVGAINNQASATVRKCVYADDTMAAGPSLSRALLSSASTGNKEFGLFQNGNGGNTDKFEYATDTRTAGAVLSNFGTGNAMCSTGNGTVGLIVGNFINFGTPGYAVNKISLAANTSVLGSRLTNGDAGSMCGTTTTGVFGARSGSGLPGQTYTYASDVTAITAPDFMSTGRGACANPVGVNV